MENIVKIEFDCKKREIIFYPLDIHLNKLYFLVLLLLSWHSFGGFLPEWQYWKGDPSATELTYKYGASLLLMMMMINTF